MRGPSAGPHRDFIGKILKLLAVCFPFRCLLIHTRLSVSVREGTLKRIEFSIETTFFTSQEGKLLDENYLANLGATFE